MQLRYYAEAETEVDHRRTLELLESIAEAHAIPVEVVQVDPQVSPPADFSGATEQRSLDDAWDDFTYNPALQDGLGAAPSEVYGDPEDIVGNVGIVVDGDLVWATRFPGTHHGWGPVDPAETAVGFLEAIEARGPDAIAERVPVDDWSLGGEDPDSDDATGDSHLNDVTEDSHPDDVTDESAPAKSEPDGVRRPTRDEIRSICTAQSFQRGVGYFEDGRVRDLSIEGSDVAAIVRGSRDYRTTVDLAAEDFAGQCTCPYDYAGDCKHVVAVLLTVADRYADLFAAATPDDVADNGTAASIPTSASTRIDDPTGSTNLDRAIADADTETLRSFLRDVLAGDDDLRERFLAVVGDPVEKSVADYRRDVDRQFEDATGRRGIVEYDTRIDFETYYDLADTYRERGEYDRALDVYRALAEGIRENLDRVDDSSGHYGREIERAIGAYADCLREAEPDADERREHVDYLFEQYETTAFGFVREHYDAALREICESTGDLEYLLSLLEPHVPDVAATAGVSEFDASGSPDPMPGPLDADLFTGDALDVDRLDAGPLELEEFVGETLAGRLTEGDDARDDRTDDDGDDEVAGSGPNPDRGQGQERSDAWEGARGHGLTGHERTVVSTYVWVLSELEDRDALRAVLEDVYTEGVEFHRRYVELLLADGRDDRAREVIEEGLDEFHGSVDAHRLAADFYRERDDERYREVLETLFVRFEDWDAYEDLKAACSDEQWASTFHRVVTRLGNLDPDRLVDLYLHEGEREQALEAVLDSEDVDVLRRYRGDVADLDPERYFGTYRDCLEPYLAAETGRDHYRTVIDHLRELEQLGFDAAFEAFIAHLKEKHSNRPALLDELDAAGL